MSTLYEIKVLKKEPTKVKLNIKVVHPDAMYIAPSPGFALMILHHMADDKSPLRKEVDDANIYSESWMKKYSFGFVKKTEVQLFNEPPQEAKYNSSHDYFNDSSKWMTGIMDLEVTHPAWIEHINENDEKDSADFDPCASYDEAEPIFPASNTDLIQFSADPKEGFIPVWKYMYYEYLDEFPDDIIWIPAYGEAAYAEKENGNGEFNNEILASLIGTYIKTKDNHGLVVKRGNDFLLFQITSGSYGLSNLSYQNSKVYSKLGFNKAKKRLSNPLSLNQIADYANPFVYETTLNGNEVVFKIVAFGNTRNVHFGSSSEVLSMIMNPLEGSMNSITKGSPLADLILKEKESRNIYFISEVYGKIAGGIILEYEAVQKTNPELPQLDALSRDEIMSAYKFERWPQWEIRIKVSDPAWLSHLKDSPEFSHSFQWVQESQPWTDELLTWDKIKPAKGLEDFKDSNVPPRENEMNTELIRRMASNSKITDEELSKKIGEHVLFLNSGGKHGRFERLEAAGMPMNIYIANASEGNHLELRMKNLSDVKVLKNAELSKADLSGCTAVGTDFSGAKLQGTMITDGLFTGANFEGADLSNVDFTGSDLRKANFRNAILHDTDFEITDCSEADFTGAEMDGSSFKGAKLTGVKR